MNKVVVGGPLALVVEPRPLVLMGRSKLRVVGGTPLVVGL